MTTLFMKLMKVTLSENALPNVMVQVVRHRKPRWLPIAKSKEFYVRKPTPEDPEEREELKHRYSHYKVAVKSIRHFLKDDTLQTEAEVTHQHEIDEASDFAWMEAETKAWNSKIAALREQRQAEEERVEEERIQELMRQRAEERLQRAIESERILQENKAASANFITPENLDEEIEKMLDSRSDYNYAITRTGKILPGEYPDRMRESNPERSTSS